MSNATHLIRDRDEKFSREFDQVLEGTGVEVVKVGLRRPVMNADEERRIDSIRRECLDHFIVFGQGHLRYLISEYVETYYNKICPQHGRDNFPVPLSQPPLEWEKSSLDEITPHQGGLCLVLGVPGSGKSVIKQAQQRLPENQHLVATVARTLHITTAR